jgi:AcrR family transcriptional regulator
MTYSAVMATQQPAARPPRAKGQARLEEVLDAAEQVLKHHGVEGLSVRAVAQQVGISVGNLQYYLPTRAALLDAVFHRASQAFRAAVTSDVATTADPREAVSRLVDVWLREQHQPEQVLFWHLWAVSAHDDAARATMDRVYGETLDFLASLLRRVQPGLTAAQAAMRAAAITSLIEGSGLFVGSGRTPPRRLAGLQREVRALVMEMVDRPPPARRPSR